MTARRSAEEANGKLQFNTQRTYVSMTMMIAVLAKLKKLMHRPNSVSCKTVWYSARQRRKSVPSIRPRDWV